MSALDLRPGLLDLIVRRGNAHALQLQFPAGGLAGRTLRARLRQPDAALVVSAEGDVLTLEISREQTADISSIRPWQLYELIGGEEQVLLLGSITGSDAARGSGASRLVVSADRVPVNVVLLGPPGPPGSGSGGGGGEGGYEISLSLPQPLGAANAGSTGEVSDAGHVHAMPTAAQTGAATPADVLAARDYARELANATGSLPAASVSGFAEAAQDAAASAWVPTGSFSFTYNDSLNQYSGSVLDSPTVAGATPAQLRDRGTHTGTMLAAAISDFTSVVDGRISLRAGVDLATLVAGKIPAAQLPSYVDDFLEYANLAAFPAVGESGKVYLDLSTVTGTSSADQYRWSGSAYQLIVHSPGSTDSLAEGSINLYFTAERVQDAVAGALTNRATASWSYNDPLNQISVTVNDSPLLQGQAGAYYLERAHHSGTQLAATISDFAATARTVPLTGLSLASAVAITATDTSLGAYGKLQAQISDAATNFAANVRGALLTGLSLASGVAITATDSVLSALGKLQKQITDLAATVSGLGSVYAADKPSIHALRFWTFEPLHGSATAGMTSGTRYLLRVDVDAAGTINSISTYVVTAGATLTSGQNLASLYDSAGNRVGITADQSTAWTSTGEKDMALTAPVNVTPGFYYIALLAVGTTVPALRRAANTLPQLINYGLAAAAARVAVNGTSQTDMPSTLTLSSNNANAGQAFWAALKP